MIALSISNSLGDERDRLKIRRYLWPRFSWRPVSKLRTVPLRAARSSRLNKRGAFFASIGAEPPIDAQGDRLGTESQRRVSPRWLAGTGLTGLIGAGLLGGAIY